MFWWICGGKKNVKKYIKSEIEEIHKKLDNYVTKENVDNIKNDVKTMVTNGLEVVLPIVELSLSQKVDIKKKKEIDELTKSFITNTFKRVTEEVKNIDNKVNEIDSKKVNKPTVKKNDDFIN
jgi:transcriptional regulator with AAA-type ATPase domain